MSSRTRRGTNQHPAPRLEESYWNALLNEGEFAHGHLPGPTPQNLTPPEIATDESRPLGRPILIDEYDDWDEIERVQARDEVLHLKVIGYNRGGLLVEWYHLRGFVPASQLVEFPVSKGPEDRRKALIDRVGELLELRVIELDPAKNRLIFSERAAQAAAGSRDHVFSTVEANDIVRGRITNLTAFGAFVDLGGVEGLIHISELSWGRVGHPGEMLTEDDEVHVFVLSVNPEEGRIALSLKRLYPDPWATVHERYRVGEIVEGQITNIVDFGAFACIEEGLEGLIHFSELAEGHFLHPRNVVAEGDLVRARILNIDGKARRLGLSLRHL